MAQTSEQPAADGREENKRPGKSRPSIDDLRQASGDLKEKIAEAKRHQDMPLNSALGNPEWEQRAADGRFDLPDQDEDS